jgi:hypothetical protein
MQRPQLQFEIIWEKVALPEAEDRLLAAFEMLFKDIKVAPTAEGPFDKNKDMPIMTHDMPSSVRN